jgi:adenylate kinase family enzyme
MRTRIHIFGASGSGTTTLAKALADTLDVSHYDTDNYFWVKTNPQFQLIRDRAERQEILHHDLTQSGSWVLSGSLCGWGDFAIPMFDLIVFLWIPSAIRMQRLEKREIQRHGSGIEDPDDPRHQRSHDFLTWAAAYDTGGLDMRSKSSHEKWIATLPSPVLRIEGDKTVQENIKTVLNQVVPNKTN